MSHAEAGDLIGDDAVIQIVKCCNQVESGVYKFIHGYAPATRTVLHSATELMLQALREIDEEQEQQPQRRRSAAMSAPTVFFIDDSATMREVIKIAFRRENIEVVACHDGDAAIAQMQQQHPDVVISDVIMPGKDGYEVCQQIKQTPGFGNTPVVLMSGVVNRNVAEKAFAVKADELIRKPFQPQDLIARVKQLLENKKNAPAAAPVPVIALRQRRR